MKISATSALVLNWADNKLWETPQASAYNSKLDLSEGDELFRLFSEHETYMHRQVISGRKYFMKKHVVSFLRELEKNNKSGQVLILAAGMAPLSFEIASLFPSCRVFDIDLYLMNEKKKMINGEPSNIEFINCDITDLNTLQENLLNHNFDKSKPTIAVMEGIIYYLKKEDFSNILNYLQKNKIVLAAEFGLKPDVVNANTRVYITEVFRKIQNEVLLEFINFYTTEEMTTLLKEAGYKSITYTNMQQMQQERTGKKEPFILEDNAWLMNVFAG